MNNKPTQYPSSHIIKVLFAVAICFVAGYYRIVAIETTEFTPPILRADFQEYYLSAYNLMHEGVYSRSPGRLMNPPTQITPDAYRPPGLPLVIATFMHLWPDHKTIMKRVQSVNVALGIAAALATYIAAASIFPLTVSVIAGLLVAASPHLIAVSVYVLTEPAAVFLVALLLFVAALGVPQKKSTSLAYFFVLGVIVGCLSLFRPIFIAFTPILALAFSGRRKIVSALLFGSLGTACVVTPWLIRNVINVPHTHGDADLIATTIVDGSYRGYLYKGNPATFPYPRLVDPNGGKAASDVALAVSKVWRDIEDDPQGMALWYLVEKPIYLLQWSNVDGVNDIFVYPLNSTPFTSRPAFLATREIFYRVHWIIVILAGVGAALAWMPFADFAFSPNRRHVLRIASLLLIFVILAHVPFFTATRYAYPVFPALYILALSGIVIVKIVGFRSSYRKAISDVHDQATQTQASVSGFRNANTKQVRTTGAASEDAG